MRGLVGPGEFPQPSGYGQGVSGIGESPGRQAPERAHQAGAVDGQPAEDRAAAQAARCANGPRVERIELGRRVVPDDAITASPSDQLEASRALSLPRRDVDENVPDRPGPLCPRLAKCVRRDSVDEGQGPAT